MIAFAEMSLMPAKTLQCSAPGRNPGLDAQGMEAPIDKKAPAGAGAHGRIAYGGYSFHWIPIPPVLTLGEYANSRISARLLEKCHATPSAVAKPNPIPPEP